MPLPDSFWNTTPAPPKIPAPSFFWRPTDTSTSRVPATKPPDWTMNWSWGSIVSSLMTPGMRGRHGDEATAGRGRVLGEEQLAAADGALEGVHEAALAAGAEPGRRLERHALRVPADLAALGGQRLSTGQRDLEHGHGGTDDPRLHGRHRSAGYGAPVDAARPERIYHLALAADWAEAKAAGRYTTSTRVAASTRRGSSTARSPARSRPPPTASTPTPRTWCSCTSTRAVCAARSWSRTWSGAGSRSPTSTARSRSTAVVVARPLRRNAEGRWIVDLDLLA